MRSARCAPEDAAAFDAALAEHPEWAHHVRHGCRNGRRCSPTPSPRCRPRARCVPSCLARVASVQQITPPRRRLRPRAWSPAPVVPATPPRSRARGPRAGGSRSPRPSSLLVGVGGRGGRHRSAAQPARRPSSRSSRSRQRPTRRRRSTTLAGRRPGDRALVRRPWARSFSSRMACPRSQRRPELRTLVRAGLGAPSPAGMFEADGDGDATTLLAGDLCTPATSSP